MKYILGIILLLVSASVALAQNVNSLIVVPSATGAAPQLACTGSDTNCSIAIVPKGTGGVVLNNVVAAPAGSAPQILGNDMVLTKNTVQAVAPAGPGAGFVTLRIRQGTQIGTCKLVAAAGNSFNQEVTVLDNIPGGTSGC